MLKAYAHATLQTPLWCQPRWHLSRVSNFAISTYAKRHKTREIPIGDSAAEFLRLVGMDSQGNRYATLRKQMHALAACRLQLGYKGRTFNGQPIEQFDAWLANRDAKQRSLWPGVMLLSESYFQELMEKGVPLDNRALMGLKGSALALDVYAWLAYRLHQIQGRPPIVHWRSLREQFGQEYKGKDPDKDFKKKFLTALQAVMAVYPKATAEQKVASIRSSYYLSTVYREVLPSERESLVIYGWGFGEHAHRRLPNSPSSTKHRCLLLSKCSIGIRPISLECVPLNSQETPP
ncbi:replication protein RepA [Burkholderia pseudomallei]|uniref:replication protein RepA n=1 Tax=Burkholderia pseudomallei TaxID=28450 RepID=UPI000A9B810C|nr:replication protein RepA [Burkholderia pseudomallei]